ncbi:MAG: hypothetical protein NTW19_25480 [Planctomycetota bacterium]|nr:hypothetical protein [Planctomycetota bacterium]
MTPILNTERVAARLGRWHPGDLAFIDAMHFTREEDDDGTERTSLRIEARFQRIDASMKVWPDRKGPFVTVVILFRGVKTLTMDLQGLPLQVEDFGIDDISSSQWEGLRFRVGDDSPRFRFHCHSIEIVDVR